MTWHCDGQDDTRAESLMGLPIQGLRYHHGGRGRRRHRFARAAQAAPTTSAHRAARDDLGQALAVERTTREALQRRIRELERKLAALSGADANLSAGDDLAMLNLKSSLSGPASGPLDLEPLQLWLAEAELRADAAEGAGGWSDGEVDLIPSLVDVPAIRGGARPEKARVAFEAAEARAAHNATQVRRLTEELAEARAEQMKTMARLREFEAKFRYAEERAGLTGDSLQNYLPEPPPAWKQPEAPGDFSPDDPPETPEEEQDLDDALAAWGYQDSSVDESTKDHAASDVVEDLSLDDALASWGSGSLDDAAASEATTDEAPATEDAAADDLDDALASWGSGALDDAAASEATTDETPSAEDAAADDLDDALAAWSEEDLSGVGGQPLDESDDLSDEVADSWEDADSASAHGAVGQVEEHDTSDAFEVDPMTGATSGFTAQEPAADFTPEAEDEAAEADTAQPYLDSFAAGEQADEVSASELDAPESTDAVTRWGTEQDDLASEEEESAPEGVALDAPEGSEDVPAAEMPRPDETPESVETTSTVGELGLDSSHDVPLEETTEAPETTDSGEAPTEKHFWGSELSEELSDAEEAQFESGLAAAASPVDYTGNLNDDQDSFEPDIALDEEAHTYDEDGDAAEIDEQVKDRDKAEYDSEVTPELHLDDEVVEQGISDSDDMAVASGAAEAVESHEGEVEPAEFTASPDFVAEEKEAQDDSEAMPTGPVSEPVVEEEWTADSDREAAEGPDAESSLDVDTIVAARRAGREVVEGNLDPETMRRSLRDWSGLAAARREKAARDAEKAAEGAPVAADATVGESRDEHRESVRENARGSREAHGKKKMVDALMRFMGDR